MTVQTRHITYDRRGSTNLSLRLKLIRPLFQGLGTAAPGWMAEKAVDMMLTPRKRPFKAQELAFLESAEQFSLPYHMGHLRAYRWGKGPRILVVHGWESKTARMRIAIKRLVEAGYEVLAFDAPAHGLSTGKQCNIFAYGAALQTMLTQYGPFHAVVGHSFGASALIYLFGLSPDLHVNRMVLNGIPPSLELMTRWFAEAVNLPSAVEQRMHGIIEDRFGRAVEDVSMVKVAPNITIPTLVYHDRDDATVPLESAYPVVRHWDSAQLRITEGFGHRRALKNREVLEEIVSFIGEPTQVSTSASN